MIKPTIGRVVWYYPEDCEPWEQPLAAIVAHVWSDTCVNLAIFDANGVPTPTPPTRVLLVQPEAEAPSGGHYCAWMPFQVGQKKAQEAGK